ncbi:MAG: nuclear transport factor 2 family protein [Acidimicrobiales bacterium]
MSDRDHLQTLLDRAAISDVLHVYATGLDAQDWALWRSAFVERIVFDLSSVTGKAPVETAVEQQVEFVRTQFAGFDATQHMITNHRHTIEGDRARVVAHMRAEHWVTFDEDDLVRLDQRGDGPAGGDRYSMFGYYDDKLVRTAEGWKLVAVQLKLTRTEGNPHVMSYAWRKGKRRLGTGA